MRKPSKVISVHLVGKRFTRLLVTKEVEPIIEITSSRKRKRRLFKCLCDCGNIALVQFDHLRQGKTHSCGCYHRETSAQNVKIAHNAQRKHSMCGTKIYKTWSSMKARCYQKNSPHYPNYGGRGISVCIGWRDSFEAFYKDMGEPLPGTSLDRINNSGNYAPINCRWATPREQTLNKRSNVFLTHNGIRQTMIEWAEKLKMHPHTLQNRIKKGWTVERALETPVMRRK